jgi:hypothetical protein
LTNIFALNPSTFSDWSTLSVLYDEFRIVGAQINVYSTTPLNSGAVVAPIVVVFDNDDYSTALTSLNQALDYRAKKQFNAVWTTGKPVILRTVVYSTGDPTSGAPWATTANPTNFQRGFKFYGTGLSTSTVYLYTTVSLVVQFRGPI